MAESEYTFQLFAPYNNAANLIADFSDWKEIAMEKGEDGYFRTRQTLADGTYAYRFNIQSKSWFYNEDEWKSISDPYSTNVDPATQNSILRLKDGIKIVDEYEWQFNATDLPTNDRIVIYEMHVGDFSGGEEDGYTRGKYTDVIAKLNYLAELGVNALELMPLKVSPGDYSWGYSPIHYFSPDPNYGSTEQLKELIDRCHGLGIRVIVDGVYNHASTETALVQIDHDYWFRHDPKNPDRNWGPEFNYEYFDKRFEKYPAREFIYGSIRFWIREYQIDGIRYDAANELDNFDTLRGFVENSREMATMKPFFNVAEYIPPSPEVTEPNGPMDSCWNDGFMYAVVEYLTDGVLNIERIKDALNPGRLGYTSVTGVVNYLANHDQNRLFRKLGEHGILDDEAYLRAKLGGLMLMTAVGVPMIWMGEEFGEYTRMSERSNKINWTLLENEGNKGLFNYYSTLIELRKTMSALHTEKIDFFHEDPDNGVLAFDRFEGENHVAVILNLSDVDLQDYAVANFPADGIWHEWLKNSDIAIHSKQLTLSLPRRAGSIFVKS